MAAIAFAFPIKPGMVEAGYKFIEEMGRDRGDDHHAAHKDHGFKVLKIWHQQKPEEMVVVYVEADHIESTRKNRNESKHEFDKWFDQTVMEITGHHPDAFEVTPLLDWHHEQKHLHVASAR